MVTVDDLILGLIASGREATSTELNAIVQQVARAPFATYLSHVPSSVRIGLSRFGITLPASKVRTVEWHVQKRIYLDKQWPVDTTEAQFVADLHQAVLHHQVQIWTYRYYSHAYVSFLAPSHIQQALQPEAFIFVAYSPVFGTITTGYQTSGVDQVFSHEFTHIVQHR